MSTGIELLTNRPKARDTYTFALDPNDATELARLQRAADAAAFEAKTRDKSPTAQKAAGVARRAAEKFFASIPSATIIYEALSPAVIETLRAEHPATPEQEEAERRSAIASGLDPNQTIAHFNPATYLPALLAAAVVRIEFSDAAVAPLDAISEKDAAAFCADLRRGDEAQLINGIELLSMGSSHIGALGKG